jgi:mono/diheme cytochrome c family protein
MIEDPQHTVPGAIMPRVPMSQATLDLIVNYLASASKIPATTPVPQRPAASAGATDTASGVTTYTHYCVACHGTRGGGDGFNAPNLPKRPTVHADPKYMSTRTDDELFDAIAAGGYVMDRSNRMPPFGETLSRDQIWKLVQYLRELCRCQGPAWGRNSR